MKHRLSLLATLCLLTSVAFAQAPANRRPEAIKPIPPLGNPIPDADRAELEKGIADLGEKIQSLRTKYQNEPTKLVLLPDLQLYHNAIRYPFVYNEPLDLPKARTALAEGLRRAQSLSDGNPDWLAKSGPRGYVSRIDGSVQPYLLILPTTYKPDETTLRRLDFFCHGRNETLTELNFISGRLPTAPEDFFLVHLYGRYCNANKFAGEIDLLETLESMKARHRIDENRVVETGFSMGGAAAWQFAVHYTDLFAAASPGAGFSESRQFLRIHDPSTVPWYEQKLWHLYDCTDYAANLFNLPTIAYAGELDGQKQASDVMGAAMEAEGLTMERLIGPNTRHEYHKETKAEIDRRLAAYAAKGRNPVPNKIRFTTWTLRYNRMFWVSINGMGKHWERTRVDAEIIDNGIQAKTQNVTSLMFSFPAGLSALKSGTSPLLTIDDSRLQGPPVTQSKPWVAHLRKQGTTWTLATDPDSSLRKRPGLQGPIDDAFLDSFIFVLPTGQPINDQVAQWVKSESDHAITHWRKQFRGEARVKLDAEITDADIAGSNLVLFGDPSSNKLLARIQNQLPIKWSPEHITVGGLELPSSTHVPLLIYPNPLNPNRYVVLNSGFTFREYDYLNNARQVPRLPDYAVLDVSLPATPYAPGKVVKAGFFDESWQLQPDDGAAGN